MSRAKYIPVYYGKRTRDCCVCDKPHKSSNCDPATLKRIDAQRQRDDESHTPPPTYADRLADGFEMMNNDNH